MFDERIGQVDGGLSAKLHDHAKRFFQFDDVHHIFGRQWLEIKFIGDRKVGRDCFWVVVDDNRFIAFVS